METPRRLLRVFYATCYALRTPLATPSGYAVNAFYFLRFVKRRRQETRKRKEGELFTIHCVALAKQHTTFVTTPRKKKGELTPL